jgi:hypothetical protein
VLTGWEVRATETLVYKSQRTDIALYLDCVLEASLHSSPNSRVVPALEQDDLLAPPLYSSSPVSALLRALFAH